MCGPPHHFAVGALHCKYSSTGKTGKMAFYAPLIFQKALKGELLVLNGCNGKTWGGTGSGMDHHDVPMAPLNTFMKLNASNGIPILPEYAFALCEPGSWRRVKTNWMSQPALSRRPVLGLVRNTSAKARAKADPKARGLSAVPPRQVPAVKTRPRTPMQPWHPRWLRTCSFHLRDQIPTIHPRSSRPLWPLVILNLWRARPSQSPGLTCQEPLFPN